MTQSTCGRRKFLRLAIHGAVATVASGCATRVTGRRSGDLADPLFYSSARQLSIAIARGWTTSFEVVAACLDRIEEVNGALNAVVRLDREGALAAARRADDALRRGERLGPLHGVPMTIKDSFDTRGIVSTGGTLGRKDHVPAADATVVRRLREAGAILMGKTNTPELTLSFDTNNLVYGQTRNPWDPTRSPGGSSGGAAAIVAAGGAPFDVGSDFGGSVRLPAHCTGICGIKPSAGRVPRTGHVFPYGGIQDAFQQIGPLARTVDDLALVLPLIAGPDGIDPGALPLERRSPDAVDPAALRVAWYADNGLATPTPATREAVRAAAQALAERGAAVTEDRPSVVDRTLEVALPIYFWNGGAGVARLLDAAGTTRHTLAEITGSKALTSTELDAAIVRLDEWRARMLSFLDRYDVLVCPVNAEPAFAIGAELGADMMARASYAIAFNVTGWPALTVPAGRSPDGLPIGVQIVAGPGREDLVLAAGRRVEAALGGFRRPPVV